MRANRATPIAHPQRKSETGYALRLFYVWAFVLAGRPQDMFHFLGGLRPALLLALPICFYMFTRGIKQNTRRFLENRQMRLFALFVGALILSIPFSYYPRASFMGLFTQYSSVILFIFCLYALVDSSEKLKRLLIVMCNAMFFYLVFFLAKGNLLGKRLAVGTMFDPNDLAFLLVSFLTYNLLFISRQSSLPIRAISLANLVLSPIAVLMTGSRGGLIALAIVIIMLFFSKSWKTRKSHKAVLAIVLFGSIGLCSGSIDFSRFDTMLHPEKDYNYLDEMGRWPIWKTGIRLMLENPVAGVGMNCFPMAIGQDREQRGVRPKWQAAHNSMIQAGTEAGVPGFFLFGLLSFCAYKIFRGIGKSSVNSGLQPIGEMCKIGFVAHLASAMFLSQAYSVYWAFYIALSAVLFRLSEDQTQGEPIGTNPN